MQKPEQTDPSTQMDVAKTLVILMNRGPVYPHVASTKKGRPAPVSAGLPVFHQIAPTEK